MAARKGTDKANVDYLYEKICAVYDNPEFIAEMKKRATSISHDDPQAIAAKMEQRVTTSKMWYDTLEQSKE
jgi:tripartite-type tricarboxylate transporter receptor subunit TctC